MNHTELVAVSSRSFSKSALLRQKLQQRFARVRFNKTGLQLKGETLINFFDGASKAIIGLEHIDDKLLHSLPNLKTICKMGTGIDKIDLDAIKRHKVAFTHTPGLNKRSVSELVLALILTLSRHLPEVSNGIKQGIWQQFKGTLLTNKTVGIIGFGAIGQDLATLLGVFNCRCLAFDVYPSDCINPNVLLTDLDTLLAESDIISLHLPLTEENYHLIDAVQFAKMKPGCILINTARGGLVDENALYDALVSGPLAAAALDVFEDEPNVPQQLLTLGNFFATAHIGGSTQEAIEAMGIAVIDSLVGIQYTVPGCSSS